MILRYQEHDKNDLTPKISDFVEKVKYGIFLVDPKLSRQFQEFETQQIIQYGAKNQLYYFLDGDEVVGLIGFRESAWDSEHFGYNVLKLDYFLVNEKHPSQEVAVAELLNEFNDFAEQLDAKLAIAKIESSMSPIIQEIQIKDFKFFECITYRRLKKPGDSTSLNETLEYRYANESDLKTLNKIASANTFEKSHFYLDKNFVRSQIDTMYQKWVQGALKEESDKTTVVVDLDGELAGMFIYSLKQLDADPPMKVATLEFLAVHKKFRNRGLGSYFFKCVIHSCLLKGAEMVDSSLVDKNIISQKLHEKFNFKLNNTAYTFHKWFK